MTHYYYDPKTNTLHGPMDDKMPKESDYMRGPMIGLGILCTSLDEVAYNNALHDYLQSLPSHPHTFTGPSRVVPEGEIEWVYRDMDIYAEAGSKVIGSFNDEGCLLGGYDWQNKEASKYLKKGESYTVDHTDVSGFHTDVYLKEFPGVSFNSVHFLSAVAIPITGEEKRDGIDNRIADEQSMAYVRCVFCDEECKPAPTNRGWSRIRYDQGLHFDCAEKVASQGRRLESEPLTVQPDKPNRYEYGNISEYLECYGDYVLRGTWNLPADFIAVNPPPSPTPQQGEKDASLNQIWNKLPAQYKTSFAKETITYLLEQGLIARQPHSPALQGEDDIELLQNAAEENAKKHYRNLSPYQAMVFGYIAGYKKRDADPDKKPASTHVRSQQQREAVAKDAILDILDDVLDTEGSDELGYWIDRQSKEKAAEMIKKLYDPALFSGSQASNQSEGPKTKK